MNLMQCIRVEGLIGAFKFRLALVIQRLHKPAQQGISTLCARPKKPQMKWAGHEYRSTEISESLPKCSSQKCCWCSLSSIIEGRRRSFWICET
jgi:hypothetical protein